MLQLGFLDGYQKTAKRRGYSGPAPRVEATEPAKDTPILSGESVPARPGRDLVKKNIEGFSGNTGIANVLITDIQKAIDFQRWRNAQRQLRGVK